MYLIYSTPLYLSLLLHISTRSGALLLRVTHLCQHVPYMLAGDKIVFMQCIITFVGVFM